MRLPKLVGGDPSLSGLEGEGELVEVLRAIAVGPPEFGVDDVFSPGI